MKYILKTSHLKTTNPAPFGILILQNKMTQPSNLFLLSPGDRPLFKTKPWLEDVLDDITHSGRWFSPRSQRTLLELYVDVVAFEALWADSNHDRGDSITSSFLSLGLVFPDNLVRQWEIERTYEGVIECSPGPGVLQLKTDYSDILHSSTPSKAYMVGTSPTLQRVWTAWFETSDKRVVKEVLTHSKAFFEAHLKQSNLQVSLPHQFLRATFSDVTLGSWAVWLATLSTKTLSTLFKKSGIHGVVTLLAHLSNASESNVLTFLASRTLNTSEAVHDWATLWKVFFGEQHDTFLSLTRGHNLHSLWRQPIENASPTTLVSVPPMLQHAFRGKKILLWGGNAEYRQALALSVLRQNESTAYTLSSPIKKDEIPLRAGLLDDSDWFFPESLWREGDNWKNVVATVQLDTRQVWECQSLEGLPENLFDLVYKVEDWPFDERLLLARTIFATEADAWRVAQHVFSPSTMQAVNTWCLTTGDTTWLNAKQFFAQQETARRALNKEEWLLSKMPVDGSVSFVADLESERWLDEFAHTLNHPDAMSAFNVKRSGGLLLSGPQEQARPILFGASVDAPTFPFTPSAPASWRLMLSKSSWHSNRLDNRRLVFFSWMRWTFCAPPPPGAVEPSTKKHKKSPTLFWPSWMVSKRGMGCL
jgi:hypothetical protein